MDERDIDPFREDLLALFETLSQARIAPTDRQVAMWFRLLAPYPLATVRAAFEAFMRRPDTGRTLPVPSDIIAKLEGAAADDGRPGPEEAWAIAIRAHDEANTVVWTAEIAEAWSIARAVFDEGDEVGARMAFREAYARLTDEARSKRKAPKWDASLGFDPGLRAAAVQSAIAQGRLQIGNDERLLLGMSEVATAASDEHRERIAQTAERIRLRLVSPPPSPDAIAKAETDRRKAEAAERVAAYERGLQ